MVVHGFNPHPHNTKVLRYGTSCFSFSFLFIIPPAFILRVDSFLLSIRLYVHLFISLFIRDSVVWNYIKVLC